MRQIFMCVLSLSLSGALTGLLILLIRPAAGRFLSKKWNYYIWLLVIARLVIPVYFDMGYSSVLIKGGAAGPEGETAGLMPAAGPEEDPYRTVSQRPLREESEIQKDSSDRMEGMNGEGISMESREQEEGILISGTGNQIQDFLPEGGTGTDWGVILGILWLTGAGISLMVKLRNYLCFTSDIKKNCRQIEDERIIGMTKDLARSLCMKKGPAIYKSGNVSVPITAGLVRPVIILPEDEWDLKDLQMVIHHELIHVKRKDLWYKWVYQCLLCIHWFNPVFYLIGIKLNIDCELSCDEAVLAALTKEGKKAYGNVLIDTARKSMNVNRNIPSTTLLERKGDLKLRLKGILRYKKTGGFRAALSICLTGIIVFLSACASVQTEADTMPLQILADAGEDDTGEESSWRPDGYSSFWDGIGAAYSSFWYGVGGTVKDWAGTGLDDFLAKPVLADQQGGAWRAYDDDSLTAGKDITGQWHMYSYMGGERIKCDGMYLNGTASVWIFNAKRDVELQMDSAFEVKAGRFKIVHVNPDGEVTVINDTGDAGSFCVNIKEGRNAIKFVGQGAKIKNLWVEPPYLREKDFESIYYSEKDEESADMTAEIREGKVDKDKLLEVLYYLEDDVVSEALGALLNQGVPLTGDELEELILYSDSDLSSAYLAEAIKNGKTDWLGEDSILDIAPYLDSEYLKEVLLVTDDISFELISECAPYLGSGRLEEILEQYLENGNDLTYSQFDELSPYLGKDMIKRLDEMKGP